jgi:hypothetical protein
VGQLAEVDGGAGCSEAIHVGVCEGDHQLLSGKYCIYTHFCAGVGVVVYFIIKQETLKFMKDMSHVRKTVWTAVAQVAQQPLVSFDL